MIRYESRKQLAEARPRVKGQFVRVHSARGQLPQGSAGEHTGQELQNPLTDCLSWLEQLLCTGLHCRAPDLAVQASNLPRASPEPLLSNSALTLPQSHRNPDLQSAAATCVASTGIAYCKEISPLHLLQAARRSPRQGRHSLAAQSRQQLQSQ